MADDNFAWMGGDEGLDDYIQTSADDLYGGVDINVDDSYWNDFWGGLNKVLSSNTTKNLLNFGSGIYGLSQANQMKNLSKDALKASDPFGPYRKVYGDQLLALMADPSSVKNLPGYQFQFDQGAEAVSRKMGSRGYAGSGNLATALTEYGQNFASSFYDKEASRLATLAGASISPSFGAGLGGYGTGIDIAGQSLASLGYGSVYAGGASQGTPATRPNAAGGEAAAVGKTISAGGSLLADLGYKDTGGAVSGVGNLISGISKGGVGGTVQAGKGAAKLADSAGYKLPEGTAGALNTAGSLANIYTGIDQGGVGGYAKAAGGVADLAGYDVPILNYADAASKLAKGDVGGAGYSGAIAYAGPIAAVGSAIADAFNKSGDKKSAGTQAVWDAMAKQLQTSGAKYMATRNIAELVLPDGRILRPDGRLRKASDALLAGDQAGYTSALQSWLSNAYVPGGALSLRDWVNGKDYGG